MKTVGFLAGALLAASPLAVSAQLVASLDFAESQYTLEAGGTFEVFVDASDSLGDFVDITSASWSSSDPAVVSVQMDAEVASIAILTGVRPGAATVSVTVGRVTASISVTVTGTPRVAITPDSVLSPTGADRIAAAMVRLEVHRFASEVSCAAAVVTDRPGLIVTSYSAIRGADRVIAFANRGQALGDVRIAAHDVGLDMAVLSAPTSAVADPIADFPEGYLWVSGYPDCGAVTTVPVSVGVAAVETGEFTLAGDITAAFAGGAITNNMGQVFGVARGGSSAFGAVAMTDQLDLATANVRAHSLLSSRQVAIAEGHLYGAVNLESTAAGASARITPIGVTAWPEIATEQVLPFTFAGPAGSYNAALLVDGRIAATRVIRVQAGVTAQAALAIPQPLARQPDAQPPPGAQIPQASGGGGGFPVPLLVVGLIGGGVAALLASKKSTPDGNGNGNTTGTVTIVVPVP